MADNDEDAAVWAVCLGIALSRTGTDTLSGHRDHTPTVLADQ
ncbi:hypothetical protein ACWGRV_08025 [Streptomyces sp. NPDC055663]